MATQMNQMKHIKDISEYKSPGNTVITKVLAAKTEEGGIYIPQEAQESTHFQIVGTGLKFDAPDLEIGDVVLVGGKGGDRVDLQNETYWIFPKDMIIAKVEL
jgi:co-chaperonin GroES (HSP10)